MRVFLSSVITGYEHYREAASQAIRSLGCEVIRAEDFPASPSTPQQACLGGVRAADIVLLLIGPRYGFAQPSGLSATHEEYLEARERKPVLVFVEHGVEREHDQETFLTEVQGWATGHFCESYSSYEELNTKVIRSLHEYELSTAAGAVDEAELRSRADALLPRPSGFGASALAVAITAGPSRQVLRPADLEDQALRRDLQQAALFGSSPVLDSEKGTAVAIRDDSLVLDQRVASVTVTQAGSVLVVQPARREEIGRSGLPVLIEEDIRDVLLHTLRFSGWVLERIDPRRRLSDVVIVAALQGTGYLPWRTRAEDSRHPSSATLAVGGDNIIVSPTPARRNRQALVHDAANLAEDLTVLLRREHS